MRLRPRHCEGVLEHRGLNRAHRHREAAFAVVAIHINISDLALDCFASLAKTRIPKYVRLLDRHGAVGRLAMTADMQ